MRKLLLFDLDGTLLKTDKTISERTLQVLEDCRKNKGNAIDEVKEIADIVIESNDNDGIARYLEVLTCENRCK